MIAALKHNTYTALEDFQLISITRISHQFPNNYENKLYYGRIRSSFENAIHKVNLTSIIVSIKIAIKWKK